MEEYSLLWRDTNSDCDTGAWQRRMRMGMNLWRTILDTTKRGERKHQLEVTFWKLEEDLESRSIM